MRDAEVCLERTVAAARGIVLPKSGAKVDMPDFAKPVVRPHRPGFTALWGLLGGRQKPTSALSD